MGNEGEDDAYAVVNRSSLKLKRVDNDETSKKKRKKDKKKKKDKEEKECNKELVNKGSSSGSGSSLKLTKSEAAFLSRKRKLDEERIREKAKVSHKERVEKFNEYLNNLSEHYEPAKVSWTK